MYLNNKIIFCLTALSFLIAGCSESGQSGNQNSRSDGMAESPVPAVEAVQARFGSLPLVQRISGDVVSENQVEIYPEISGRVTEVYVENGERVEKGQPLVKIHDRIYREQVQQAQASLKVNEARLLQAKSRLGEVEARYKRTQALAEKELSSDMEMETLNAELQSAKADVTLVEAQLDQAKSQLDEAKENLSLTIINAPVVGTVGGRVAEVGMRVTSNNRLFTMGDLTNLKIIVPLTDQMLEFIEVGQTARVFANDDSEKFVSAEVARISPFLNTVSRSTEAEIHIGDAQGLLKPGMFVPVDILYGESEQATLIPKSALYTNPATGQTGVYVASSIGSEVQPVMDGESDELGLLTEPVQMTFKEIEVLASGRMDVGVTGVSSSDWVVTVGQNLLSRGRNEARVRTVTWERVLALQNLQRQDLLDQVLEQTSNDSSNNNL